MIPKKVNDAILPWLTRISPRLNTYRRYYHAYHKFPDLKNPRTFDEKLLWLKLNRYGTDLLVRQCADKWAVRRFVEERGCKEILNDLIGVYDTEEQIDWQGLPQQFVMKMNVGCGYNLVCTDKSKLNIEEARDKVKKWEKEYPSFWLKFSELQYKDVPGKILCERFITSDDGLLPADYKLFCFDGEAKYVMLCTKRETGHPEFYFFDRDRKLVRLNKRGLAAPDDLTVDFPPAYDQLFCYAEKLSKGFPFVRADFYIERDRIIFGELTFTPCTGIDDNIPPEQNSFIGSLIKI